MSKDTFLSLGQKLSPFIHESPTFLATTIFALWKK